VAEHDRPHLEIEHSSMAPVRGTHGVAEPEEAEPLPVHTPRWAGRGAGQRAASPAASPAPRADAIRSWYQRKLSFGVRRPVP